ncbi:thiol-disulfide isomerase/thioredoxin [Mucilaginibacter gracilis]|uniref:Thiol-disulfide isomerase/thioredoxin n=1 Tax=Mucilaginibacter gracilis TaxID=423350 RepID=A0A495J8P8_9SPHI|nr:TlpA disulfide reductase family protein [Mucilaginibacter gracilis]RKR84848.1 thiol-disulfide isomerase/thioredoxin [Mucilaginibacter gracilis]
MKLYSCIFILIAIIFNALPSKAQLQYAIEVNISNSNGEFVYLADAQGGASDRSKIVKVDSAQLINGKCVFKGQFNDLKYYSIAFKSKGNYAGFIIDTGKIKISANGADYLYKSLKVESKQNQWLALAKRKMDSIEVVRERFQDSLLKYENKNEILTQKYSKLMDIQDSCSAMSLLFFIKNHPDSYYNFLTLKQLYKATPQVFEMAKQIFPFFSNRLKDSQEGKDFQTLLFRKSLEKTFMPSITLYNAHKKIETINFKSSIYLIDYWASWCGPCIAKFPYMRSLLTKYNSKGFKLLSISLDNNYQKWVEAVRKQRVDWPNYLDLNAFESRDAKLFDIINIPFTILVDKTGKIVKLNPSDQYLEKYLLEMQP